MPRVRAGDGVDRLAGLHRVGAATAVHMQVDEAGQHDRQGAVAPGLIGRRLAEQCNDAAGSVRERATQPAVRRQDQAVDRVHSKARWLAWAK